MKTSAPAPDGVATDLRVSFAVRVMHSCQRSVAYITSPTGFVAAAKIAAGQKAAAGVTQRHRRQGAN